MEDDEGVGGEKVVPNLTCTELREFITEEAKVFRVGWGGVGWSEGIIIDFSAARDRTDLVEKRMRRELKRAHQYCRAEW